MSLLAVSNVTSTNHGSAGRSIDAVDVAHVITQLMDDGVKELIMSKIASGHSNNLQFTINLTERGIDAQHGATNIHLPMSELIANAKINKILRDLGARLNNTAQPASGAAPMAASSAGQAQDQLRAHHVPSTPAAHQALAAPLLQNNDRVVRDDDDDCSCPTGVGGIGSCDAQGCSCILAGLWYLLCLVGKCIAGLFCALLSCK